MALSTLGTMTSMNLGEGCGMGHPVIEEYRVMMISPSFERHLTLLAGTGHSSYDALTGDALDLRFRVRRSRKRVPGRTVQPDVLGNAGVWTQLTVAVTSSVPIAVETLAITVAIVWGQPVWGDGTAYVGDVRPMAWHYQTFLSIWIVSRYSV